MDDVGTSPLPQTKPSFFPQFMLILSILLFCLGTVFSIAIVWTGLSIFTIYNDFGKTFPSTSYALFLIILLPFISAVSIFYALRLKKQQKTHEITPRQQTYSILLTAIPWILLIFVSPFFIMLLVSPLQSLIGNDNAQAPQPSARTLSIPTPDPIANWETYTNQRMKIMFKYPPKWQSYPIQTIDSDTHVLLVIHPYPKSTYTASVLEITTNKNDFIAYQTLNPCKGVGEKGYTVPCLEDNVVDAKVLNMSAKKINVRDSDTSGKLYLQTTQSPYLQISYGDKDFLDQMLSTFTFLDQDKNSSYQTDGISKEQAIAIAQKNGFTAPDLEVDTGYDIYRRIDSTHLRAIKTIRIKSCQWNKTMHLDPTTGEVLQYKDEIWCGGIP